MPLTYCWKTATNLHNMGQDPFKKFINPKKNSVVKEEIRQEKKQARKEKRAFFDQIKADEYKARMAKRGTPVKDKTDVAKQTSSPVKPNTGATLKQTVTTDVAMPLNKFLAHCGICSRRDAIPLIADGTVKVNGATAKEPGYKVQPADEVIYNGKKLFITKNLVYILLNKPKDYITTTDDPQGRKTVLQLIQKATAERVYPVGRLDRNTSGVLLLTNDGDLTQKLSHPSYEIKKIYEVKLDKILTKADFEKILTGLILEDGQIFVDSLAYADAKDKSVIGIEIHSGRNRIVRRIFESLGYDVKGLDRVMYAGLTKKNVERSKWRYLSDKEIRVLKYLNESKKKTGKTLQAVAPVPVVEEKKLRNPDKPRGRDYSNEEIAEAIGDTAVKKKTDFIKKKFSGAPATGPVKKDRETKTVKPRKFKTHSEKKKHQNNNLGKK